MHACPSYAGRVKNFSLTQILTITCGHAILVACFNNRTVGELSFNWAERATMSRRPLNLIWVIPAEETLKSFLATQIGWRFLFPRGAVRAES